MEEPPPWLSPDRIACAASVTPWLMVCPRRMRCAQAGGLAAEPVAAGAAEPESFATVPMLEEPPVAPKPLLTPSAKLERTLCAARRSGEAAAPPAARATPPRPDATPAAPD